MPSNVNLNAPKSAEVKGTNPGKLKIDIFVPLNVCACMWEKFIERVFNVLSQYIKYIDHETKSLDSEEAHQLNLFQNTIVIDSKIKILDSFDLKQQLPKILKEKGLI